MLQEFGLGTVGRGETVGELVGDDEGAVSHSCSVQLRCNSVRGVKDEK